MLGTHDLALFVISGLLLNITPGADSLYIATRSASGGLKAGIAAALGISAGCLMHVLGAALGLSAIMATSLVAFTVVKFVGAAYLVYIGLSMLLKNASLADTASALPAVPLLSVFQQGFLTNVLNPKVALFFLAFVPQFIDPGAPHKALAFLFLGLVFTFNGTLWCLLLAWSSARIGALGLAGRGGSWLGRLVGGLFVAMGVRLAISD